MTEEEKLKELVRQLARGLAYEGHHGGDEHCDRCVVVGIARKVLAGEPAPEEIPVVYVGWVEGL